MLLWSWRCRSCGRPWLSAAKETFCPFCGSERVDKITNLSHCNGKDAPVEPQ